MNIFVVLALAMLLIIVALRKKVPIGPAILAGGLLIWVAVKPEIPLLGEAAKQMFTMQRTYDLLFALYLDRKSTRLNSSHDESHSFPTRRSSDLAHLGRRQAGNPSAR